MRVWAVMVRDLLRISRNPVSLVAAVLMPLLYLLILGNTLQGPLRGLPLGVVSLDQGPQARALLGALQAVEHGPGTIEIVVVHDPVSGFARLRDGELSGLLVVPPRFSRDLSRGVAAAAGLYVDNVDAIAAAAIENAVAGAIAAIREPLVRLERHLGEAQLRPQEIYPRVDYDTSLVPGVVVLSIFMGSMITGAFNLVMDRFLGVHESYLSTPLRRFDINVGVLLSGTVVTLCSSGLVLVIGFLMTGSVVHGGVLGYLANGGTGSGRAELNTARGEPVEPCPDEPFPARREAAQSPTGSRPLSSPSSSRSEACGTSSRFRTSAGSSTTSGTRGTSS